MAVGISSLYYSKTHREGTMLLESLLELGFDGLELEYRISPAALAEMLPVLKKRHVRVYSVHNFLPHPKPGLPGEGSGADAFLFSSLERDERQEAVKKAIGTLEVAERVEARAVVLHLGRVEYAGSLRLYKKLAAEGKGGTPEGRRLLEDFLSRRAAHRAPFLDSVLWCLDRLNNQADRRGLLLGIENRYHLREIPDHEETGMILKNFQGGAVRYWHDVGHALYQQNLGHHSQERWLQSYSGQLAGAHLHDIRGFSDHLAPGTGEADFSAIRRFLPPNAIKIMEVGGTVPRAELLAGRRALNDLGY